MPALQMLKRITFIYPSKNIGGAQILFARLANYIATTTSVKVYVVDYRDGFIRNYLKNIGNIVFVDYSDGVSLPKGCINITPLSHLADLKFMVSESSLDENFLLWSIHPDNIKYLLHSNFRSYFRLGNKNFKRRLIEMANAKTIAFMDGATKFSFEKEVGAKIEAPFFLPIPIEFNSSRLPIKKRKDNSISVAWLGRFSYDKIYAIIKLIRDVAKSQYKENIKLYLIGDGQEYHRVIEEAKKNNISLYHPGVIQAGVLDNYLMDNIDVGIVMGTSCLEISKLKIPTAIIDYSLVEIPSSHGYDWFYESSDYSLGNDAAWGLHRRMTFDHLIEEFLSDQNNLIGTKCYGAAIDNHSIESTVAKILDLFNLKQDAKQWGVIANIDLITNPIIYTLIYKIGKFVKNLLNRFLVLMR